MAEVGSGCPHALPRSPRLAPVPQRETMHYTGMDVWQRSVDLAVEIYDATSKLPKEETYGLRAQIRRAAVSIASNIAEGMGRNSDGEEIQFFGIARGSLFELQTQL